MADQTETLRLLHEIRAAQEVTNARLDEANAKLDAFIASTDIVAVAVETRISPRPRADPGVRC
jgi:hypothetical protein